MSWCEASGRENCGVGELKREAFVARETLLLLMEGTVIGDKFRLIRKLGQGSFGELYLGICRINESAGPRDSSGGRHQAGEHPHPSPTARVRAPCLPLTRWWCRHPLHPVVWAARRLQLSSHGPVGPLPRRLI